MVAPSIAALFDDRSSYVEPLGAGRDGVFIVMVNDSIVVIGSTAAMAPRSVPRPCCHGFNDVSLSPDGASVTGTTLSDDFKATQLVVLDVATETWRVAAILSRRTAWGPRH